MSLFRVASQENGIISKSGFNHFMTVNTKRIKIVPAPTDGDTQKEDLKHDNDDRNWPEWALKYIEFIGNFVILFFMLTFITIYWTVGLVYMYIS